MMQLENGLSTLQSLVAEVFVVNKVSLFYKIAHITPENTQTINIAH